MGIKHNNPGCNCCDEGCENCLNGKLPDGLDITIANFANEIYIYKSVHSFGSQPSCTLPTSFPVGTTCVAERYKITGLSSILNKTHSITGLTLGPALNGFYDCALQGSVTYSASGHIQQAEAFFGAWQDCRARSYDVRVRGTSFGVAVDIIDTFFTSVIGTFTGGGGFVNDYCDPQSQTVAHSTQAPTFSTLGSSCIASGFAGNYSSWTTDFTITPTFPP